MRVGDCTHFTGYQNGKCKCGVNYRELVGGPDLGWAARLPCLPESPLRKPSEVKCDKFRGVTKEEQDAHAKEISERFAAISKAISEIRKVAKENNINGGWIHCPNCTKPLHFNIAKLNGHIWAKCETENCLQWMQ